MGVALLGAISTFSLGFGFYYLLNRKVPEKESISNITLQLLQKIVEKIKHVCTYNLVIMYDKIKDHGPSDDEIKIFSEPLKDEDKVGGENTPRDDKSALEKLANFQESPEEKQKKKLKEELKNPEKLAQILCQYELQSIQSFQVTPREYLHNLEINCDDENIKKDLEFLKSIKKAFDQGEKFPIVFPDSVVNNYLKIISNIYYLNLKKVQLKLKKDFNDKNINLEPMMANRVINELYRACLRETRQQVIEFFNISGTEQLNAKHLLRIYILTLSKSDPLRKEYIKMNDEINEIILEFSKQVVFDEFIDETSPIAINSPIDCKIEFSQILKNQRFKSDDKNKDSSEQFDEIEGNKNENKDDTDSPLIETIKVEEKVVKVDEVKIDDNKTKEEKVEVNNSELTNTNNETTVEQDKETLSQRLLKKQETEYKQDKSIDE